MIFLNKNVKASITELQTIKEEFFANCGAETILISCKNYFKGILICLITKIYMMKKIEYSRKVISLDIFANRNNRLQIDQKIYY